MNPDEYMCPNCVTPWKCNGPHILNTNPNEHIEYIYHIYNDLQDVIRSEGINNVLTDLENLYPEMYRELIDAVIVRNKIRVNGVLLTKNAT